jgi:methylated-DNA-protein-cysteine methyltransferase-like protein
MASAKKKTREPSAFERVWQVILRIPRGRAATYGQISNLIDRRLTPIGVGWAIRAAPEGAIPWHRVVNAGGGISTDGEHPGLQRAMLEAEGVRFDAGGRIDLERFGWRPRAPVAKSKKPPARKKTPTRKKTMKKSATRRRRA